MSSLRDRQTQLDTRDPSGKTNENCSWSSWRIAEEFFWFNSQFIYINHPLFQGLFMHINYSRDGRVGSIIPTCLNCWFLMGEKKTTLSNTSRKNLGESYTASSTAVPSHLYEMYTVLKSLKSEVHYSILEEHSVTEKPQHAVSTSSLVFPRQVPMLWPFLPFPNGLRSLCFTWGPDLSGWRRRWLFNRCYHPSKGQAIMLHSYSFY